MNRIGVLLLLLGLNTWLAAQTDGVELFHSDRVTGRTDPMSFNPDWAPFYHGVASGDPLTDRVIIWTRVTPEEMNGEPVEVSWQVATDPLLENVVQSGNFTTGPERDYTVKVDVAGLTAGTTYYYGFSAMGTNSLTGKTKTTPAGDQADHLKFGVVSCSNFQAGYFNAYKRLSERTDLDAVIHLGDYIYENPDGSYGDEDLFDLRPLDPETELLSLEDYRARYSTYRLDTALARVHQQHPFITIWDDHESANDAYIDGAQAHNPETEGDWEERKAAAKQAYFEWLPIRDTEDQSVYRKISYGDLLDLIMLDTRLEGREQQLNDVEDPALTDPDRTILGAEQKAWFLDQLANSTAKWKLIGQQVIFSELNVGWASLATPDTSYQQFESFFLDIWDGYPAERSEIINFVSENEIDNVVVLTGDFHSSFAFDVIDAPASIAFIPIPGVGNIPLYSPNPAYNVETGEGAAFVEFATPSITSANFDENVTLDLALFFQATINQPIVEMGFNLGNPNPHMRFTDLVQHGYFIIDVKADSAQADFFFSPIDAIVDNESFSSGWYSRDGENYLNEAAAPSAGKEVQDTPAPNDPPLANSTEALENGRVFALLGLYPNPFSDRTTLHYSLTESTDLRIDLYDANGRMVRNLIDRELLPGVFNLQLDAQDLPEGTYFYRIQAGAQQMTAKVVRTK